MDKAGWGEKINRLEVRYKRNKSSEEMKCIYACVRVCIVFAN